MSQTRALTARSAGGRKEVKGEDQERGAGSAWQQRGAVVLGVGTACMQQLAGSFRCTLTDQAHL